MESNELTDRERAEVLFALLYAGHFRHGAAGHNGYLTLAKVATAAGYALGWIHGDEPTPVLYKDGVAVAEGN